ncbi:hypothetical protein [Streptomyces sp. CRN 30]|uniref:hypothetical protein n=1 Tax=Streptomyces sp. CRN 30 TaxID=3075613 RepID=UPI002A7EE67D|nr:hypothetical protein [Streptomyces sp. CRN 30]
MSAAALAATEAAPHAQPPRAAAAVHPRAGGLTIKAPLRLVVGAQYPDRALSTYVKVAALALRPEGCTARVATLAAYLGVSKSSVERGLRPLTKPDPVDGLIEIPTVRRTARGGTGESAHRVTRPLAEGELWVRIPVRAAEALSPRLLRLYALLTYAVARTIPVTMAELAEMLRHDSGTQAGESLDERTVRRLVDELEATGWITVHRREGVRGRHAYEIHRHPLHSVPAPPETEAPADGETGADQDGEQLTLWAEAEDGAPVIHDGSGPDDLDGSLASKEDHPTDRPDETNPVGVDRRRRGDRKWVAAPVDNATLPDTFRSSASRAPLGNRPIAAPTSNSNSNSQEPSGYTGPQLRWTRRIHEALAPVRHELASIRPFVLRRLAREIGAQLDTGVTPERMAARIGRRYRAVERAAIRDMGAWLLAVGIPRRGDCTVPECEEGTLWPHLGDCRACGTRRAQEQAWWREARRLDARLQEIRQQNAEQRADAEARRERRAAGRARAQLLQDLGDGTLPAAAVHGPPAPEPELGPAMVLPPKKSYRERDAASDEEVLAAVAAHGQAVALHLYGHLRVLPLLRGLHHPDQPGHDRRTHHAQ